MALLVLSLGKFKTEGKPVATVVFTIRAEFAVGAVEVIIVGS